MISTVELCVRNFVDHGYNRERSVAITGLALFIFGLPSAVIWIKQILQALLSLNAWRFKITYWGYGLMFLEQIFTIAFSIWKYGYLRWKAQVEAGEAPGGFKGYLGVGVSAFRDDFINTGDNDIEVGRWWDILLYIAFPDTVHCPDGVLFQRHDSKYPYVWNPANPKGLGDYPCVLGSNCNIFHFPKQVSNQRPIFRNIPEARMSTSLPCQAAMMTKSTNLVT